MNVQLHDGISERSMIGAILYTGDDAYDLAVLAGVTDQTFCHDLSRDVWRVFKALREKAKAIDLPSVAGAMGEPSRAKELDEMVDLAVPSHLQFYIDEIRDKELLRLIIDQAYRVQEWVESGDSAEEIRSRAEFAFGELRQNKTIEEMQKTIIARQMKIWEEATVRGCAGIPTGFRMFDDGFGGMMDAALYILSGPKACGKTTLARNIAENIAMRGVPVSFCSLEQTAEQIWGSIIGRKSCQSVWKLNCGHKYGVDWHRLTAAAQEVRDWPLYVDDKPKTPTQLWSWARREISKHGSKLLVLDYLQAMKPDQKYNSDEARITAYSDCCRSIAKDLRIPFLVLSALSNTGNLRGSGMIGYDAWAHVSLRKADDWTHNNLHYLAAVDKQRFGPELADTDLYLIGNEQRFEERKTEEEQFRDRTQQTE